MKRLRNEKMSKMRSVEDRVNRNVENPMANEVIVKRLFEIMPFELDDFKNFRLVSKLWWEIISLPAVRKNAWLSLTDKNVADRSSSKISRSSIQFYMDWLKLPNDPYQLHAERKQFTKYALRECQLKLGGSTRQNQRNLEFWRATGPTMSRLRISNCKFNDADDLGRILFELTPNLFHLILNLDENMLQKGFPVLSPEAIQTNGCVKRVWISWDFDGFLKPQFSLFLMGLLPHFPNLKLLRLGDEQEQPSDESSLLRKLMKGKKATRVAVKCLDKIEETLDGYEFIGIQVAAAI